MANMKHYLFLLLLCSCFGYSQNTLPELLKKHNNKSIPYISVQELAMPITNAIILDAREPSEYNISHIKKATLVGYKHFNLDEVVKRYFNKDDKIVVYCSIGIRSETIAEQLKKAGYTNVFNLYGGIFEWKNNNFPIVDLEENETEKIHAFNKSWSKWITKGELVFD